MEKWANLSENVTKIIKFICVLFTIGTTCYFSIDKSIQVKISNSVNELEVKLNKRISVVEEYIYDDMVLAIDKQYSKIRKDPYDIKIYDIEKCLKYWYKLPQEYKTDVLTEKYKVIYKWFLDNKQ